MRIPIPNPDAMTRSLPQAVVPEVYRFLCNNGAPTPIRLYGDLPQGYRNESGACPIAFLIWGAFPAYQVEVEPDAISLRWDAGDGGHFLAVKKGGAISRFVSEFDMGRWPDYDRDIEIDAQRELDPDYCEGEWA